MKYFKVKREERQREDRRSSGRGAEAGKSRLYGGKRGQHSVPECVGYGKRQEHLLGPVAKGLPVKVSTL